MQSSWPELRSALGRPRSVQAPSLTPLLDALCRYELAWAAPLVGLALLPGRSGWLLLGLAGLALPLGRRAGRSGARAGLLAGPLALFQGALAGGLLRSVDPAAAELALRSYLGWGLIFLLLLRGEPGMAIRRILAAGTLALLVVAPLCFAPVVEENRKVLSFNAWAFELGSALPVRFFHAPHPNGVAVALAVALPLLMAAALDSRSRAERLGWLALGTAGFLFIAISASRAAWVGVALGLFVLTILQGGRSLRWSAGLAGLTLLAALTPGRPSAADLERLSSTWSLMERRQQWSNTLQMISWQPLLGHGLGSFPHLYPRTMGPGDIRPHETPNNAYLQIVVDGGLPAAAALAWFGAALGAEVLRLRPARGRWGRWPGGLASSMVVLAWSGLLETSSVVAFVWKTGGGGYYHLGSPLPFLLAAVVLQVARLERSASAPGRPPGSR